METNKYNRPILRPHVQTRRENLKAGPLRHHGNNGNSGNDEWLNDIQSSSRSSHTSASFVGIERLETVPLTHLTTLKPLVTVELPTEKMLSAPPPSNAETIGLDHSLWPLLLQLSTRLWKDIHSALSAQERRVALPSAELVRKRTLAILRAEPKLACTVHNLADAELLLRCVVAEVIGFGPLETLLRDETITEIIVCNPTLILVKREAELHEVSYRFADEQHMLRVLENMLCRVGQNLSFSHPFLHIALPGNLLVQAILPPLSTQGPVMLLRRRKKSVLTLAQLVEKEMLSPAMADFLQFCMQAHVNIVIAGKTNTGKTTFLNALCALLPERERIISIENAPELDFRQKGIISLTAHSVRSSGHYNATYTTVSDLLTFVLPLHPEHLIVGSCEDDKEGILLKAMYNGQRGTMTTLYAQSIRDALVRLEQFHCSNNHVTVSMARKQLVQSVNIVVYLSRLQDGTHKITNIAEIVGVDKDSMKIQSLFYYDTQGTFKATDFCPSIFEANNTSLKM